MPHEDPADIPQFRIIYDGDESFSDPCRDCGHTRSSHLERSATRPIGGRNCRVELCAYEYEQDDENPLYRIKLDEDGLPYESEELERMRHSEHVCDVIECPCILWEAVA